MDENRAAAVRLEPWSEGDAELLRALNAPELMTHLGGPAEGLHRHLHAFPRVDHPASNAVCRAAGFELLGPQDFEYSPGHPIRSNDWRLDLERF
ncbi:hypothetical protein [Kitasatospora purpeofusca]|uniref:hypothetical protein n=1 Tax=Kitasatospora purpeofusca TaxID=67352 RepID=UPI00386C5AA8|nr:hypothetical protein OIP63_04335 [Kitasatospora purpeofusca]